MKCLVTGGAGFIGTNLVRKLIARGDSVRILDNFSTGKRQNVEEINDHCSAPANRSSRSADNRANLGAT